MGFDARIQAAELLADAGILQRPKMSAGGWGPAHLRVAVNEIMGLAGRIQAEIQAEIQAQQAQPEQDMPKPLTGD